MIKICVFSAGFHGYWPQFADLRERLDAYSREFETRIAALGA